MIDTGGKPVDGAAVAIVDGPGTWPDIACLTGADGRFVLGTPSTGRYKLGVRSDDHDYTEAVVAIEGVAIEDEHRRQATRSKATRSKATRSRPGRSM